MFQSAGLFRDVSCPYYIFGLCERPYCHFKHSKHDGAKVKAAVSQATTVTTDTPSSSEEGKYSLPSNALERTLKDIEENIKNEKNKLKDKSGGADSGNKPAIKTKPTGTPEYNPTPISELKKQKNKSKLGQSKYDLALLDKPSSEQEYDPASNYITSFKGTVPEYAAGLHSAKRLANTDAEAETTVATIPKFVSVEYTPATVEPEFSDEEPVGDKEDWFSDEESAKDSTNEQSDKDTNSHSDIENPATQCDSVTKDSTSAKADSNTESSKKSDINTELLPFEFTPEGFIKPFVVEPTKDKKTDKQKNLDSKNDKEKIPDSRNGKQKNLDSKKDVQQIKRSEVGNEKNDETKRSKKETNIFSIFKAAVEHVLSNTSIEDKSDLESAIYKNKSGGERKEEKPCKANNLKTISGDSEILSDLSSSKPSQKKKRHDSHKNTSSETKSTSKSEKDKGINPLDKSNKEKHKIHHEKKRNNSLEDKTNGVKDKSNSDDSTSKSKHFSHKIKRDESRSSHTIHKTKGDDKRSPHLNHKSKDDKKYSHSSVKHHQDSKHREASKSKDLHVHDRNSKSVKQTSPESKVSDNIDTAENAKIILGDKSKSESLLGKRRRSSEKVKKMVKTRKIVDLNVDLFGADSDTETKDKGPGGKNVKKPEFDLSNLDDIDAEIDMCRSSPNENEFDDLEKYFSDEDPFDECLRIFNEEGANIPSTSGADKKKLKKKELEDKSETASGKKRVGMKPNDPNEKKPTIENKPVPKPSPAQVMMNRYKMMQQKAIEAQEAEKEKIKQKVRKISAKNALNAPPSTSKTIAGAGASFSSYLASKKSPQKKTTAITVSKGQKRKAHTPTVPVEKLKRPVVEVSTSSKVPTNIRQRYLNLMIDECLKLYKSQKEAFDRATEEEKAVYMGVSNKHIYLNKAVNTIKRLRTEKDNRNSPSKTQKTPVKMSHVAMLDGASATKSTYTLHRSGGAVKIREEDFTGTELYERLVPYQLTEEQLKENNFPRPDPTSGGKAVFLGEDIHTQKARTKGYEKVCIRCGKIFEVYPNGKYPKKEDCVYHWGRAYKKKIGGALETRYTCCSGDLSSEGCQVCKAHVHETNKKENLSGYMKTIPCSPPPGGGYGVYALDCEMVYTTQGIELARVTVVGSDLEPIYESLVKPDRPVVDYNTRFSGISEEDLEDVSTSLRDVQAVLLSLFTDKTILIGHSLESDLTALKLIHSSVVDTSIVFPHRLGPPYKRALKNLMAEYLKKIIQDDVTGHDSNEDAISCLQLMQLRLKEDARKEGRR